MQKGEHNSGGTADTGQGAAPAHAAVDAAGGTAASGWLDRVALHNQPEAPAKGALRPRLPYPFEAMRFATADAGPRVPMPASPLSQPEEAAATPARVDRADDQAQPPASDALRAPRIEPIAMEPAKQHVAAPLARHEPEHHALASARPVDRLELTAAKSERAPQDQAVHGPAAAPAALSHPVPPAQPARPASPEAASPQMVATRRIETAALPAATQAGQAPGQATNRSPSTPRNGKPVPLPAEPRTGGVRKPAAEQPRPALRGAPPSQTPLAATLFAGAASEITIDIHIGRIDVRAPAGAPAPAAAQAPPQRGGEALNTYLARRARGARS